MIEDERSDFTSQGLAAAQWGAWVPCAPGQGERHREATLSPSPAEKQPRSGLRGAPWVSPLLQELRGEELSETRDS